MIYWNENLFRADIKYVFHDMTLDNIAHPKYVNYAFILDVWDSNSPTLPAVLVAWKNDEFDEEGARLVEPLALGKVLDLQRCRTVLMDHLRIEGEKQPTYFPARSWCLKWSPATTLEISDWRDENLALLRPSERPVHHYLSGNHEAVFGRWNVYHVDGNALERYLRWEGVYREEVPAWRKVSAVKKVSTVEKFCRKELSEVT